MKKDNKVPTTNKVGSQIKTMFDKEAGFEANALAIITAIWVSPILLAYFILKFAIIRPIKSLFGVKKK